MNLNFLDIGTSDFDISSFQLENSKTCLLVEPLQNYLDNIPNSPNIIKANYAISNVEDFVNIFYITEENIKKYNLPYWVKGCNKINTKHPTIVNLLQQLNLDENIIFCKKVKCISFNTLLKLYNITHIESLKIDTEGHDHVILEDVVKCILEKNIEIDKIKLEYLSAFGNIEQIDKIRNNITHIYPIQNITGEDIILSK